MRLPFVVELGDALRAPEFLAGCAFGTIALAIAVVTLLGRRVRGQRGVPRFGLLLVGAAWLAVVATNDVPIGVGVGLLALAAAGMVRDRTTAPAPIPLLMACAGSFLLALAGDVPQEAWIRALIASVVPPAAMLLADFDARRAGEGRAFLLLAVSATGVFATVPDTEHALALLGAALPLALMSFPYPFARLGGAGAFAATGLLVWTVAVGGAGRHSSVIGGVACLGVLAIEPLVHRLRIRRIATLTTNRNSWRRMAVLGAGHVVFVSVSARIVGLRDSTAEAALLATVLLAAALLIGWLVLAPAHEQPGRGTPL